MNVEHVKAEFAALLRERPRGTTADVTEHTLIYWDGDCAVGVHLCVDHPVFEDRFELDDRFVGDAHEHLAEWFSRPHYSTRTDLIAWLDNLPNCLKAGE
jgi:hypothetical protein